MKYIIKYEHTSKVLKINVVITIIKKVIIYKKKYLKSNTL